MHLGRIDNFINGFSEKEFIFALLELIRALSFQVDQVINECGIKVISSAETCELLFQ
jgi:hypothetical protein